MVFIYTGIKTVTQKSPAYRSLKTYSLRILPFKTVQNSDTMGVGSENPSKKIKINSEKIGDEKNALMWFRTDLRVTDNRALEAAIACVKKNQETSSSGLFALFFVSIGEWKNHLLADIKVQFIMRNLKDLAKALHKMDVPLIFKLANSPDSIPSEVLSICKSYNIKNVFYNIEYEVNEAKRDSLVCEALKSKGIEVGELHDQCIVKPGDLKTKSSNTVFTVFTPFKNSWFQHVEDEPSYLKESDLDTEFSNTCIKSKYPDLFEALPPVISEFNLSAGMEKQAIEMFPSGESAALKRLTDFVSEKITVYKEKRDIPSLPNTSGLSPYLAIGVISARQCVNYARKHNKEKLTGGNLGIDTWISEIIWRDFYRHVLVGFPRVCKNIPFKVVSKNIEWSTNEIRFTAWKEGKTGYPIVDAGMRQLLATGWMHNRVRMVTAMFLTKDLHINWQKGEDYFMRHLIDGDFASNNGGWQWSASTGTDAQPYFRIFNPALQSAKFDPSGEYIKKWIPELKNVPAKLIHEPYKSMTITDFMKTGYPKPIVDHSTQRLKAIEIYAKVFKSS